MTKKLLILPLFVLASCVMTTDDAQLSVNRDLSASASFLVAFPILDGDSPEDFRRARETVREFVGTVQSCGGTARQFPSLSSRSIKMKADFHLADARAKSILLTCLMDSPQWADATYSRQPGFLRDQYTLRIRISGRGESNRTAFLSVVPASLSFRLPGRIESVSDQSNLPWHDTTWERADGLATMTNAATEAARNASSRESSSAKNENIPSMHIDVTIRSSVPNYSTAEAISMAGGLAGILSLLAVSIRAIIRRIRRRRADPAPPPPPDPERERDGARTAPKSTPRSVSSGRQLPRKTRRRR